MGNLYDLSINLILINLNVVKEAESFTNVVYSRANSVFEIDCFFFVIIFLSFIFPLPFITFFVAKTAITLFYQINFSSKLILLIKELLLD